MRMIVAAVAFLFAVSLSGQVSAGERGGFIPAQTKCPISGKSVDGSFFADVDGFRVLTAGQAEADQVLKNPGKAFNALAKNREAAEPIVWVCPSMKQGVSREYPYVQQSGKRIYYCCGPCQPRIRNNFKAAAAEMKRLAEQGS